MALLDIRELHAGHGQAEVLHGVSLTADESGITAVIGPNGAGKTTLAQTICGLLRPISGSVLFDGEPVDRRSPRERALAGIGYAPQGRNVFPQLTVRENLDVVIRSFRIADDRVEEVLGEFPILRERQRQRAGTLSGGERQQLALGCALLARPKLLVLDEPTTGLAPQIVAMLIDKILEIRARGAGVLWIIEEHPMQILGHCDSVCLLESGQIRHRATGSELVADPSFAEMFLGAGVPGEERENCTEQPERRAMTPTHTQSFHHPTTEESSR